MKNEFQCGIELGTSCITRMFITHQTIMLVMWQVGGLSNIRSKYLDRYSSFGEYTIHVHYQLQTPSHILIDIRGV